ncbi:histidine kinase [Spongiactinospora sp. TRM90649]|uniref:sensor histidine kinase n=1 Tax=Spongiactinospora sp. TRM90649 TaxID=3031114 RepID=UPI0023F7E4EF|nr:histidine kinase [Spongiactinospora sp. TRM90649]MDF5757751.1 histidine kinase [Spongiactinospora sp. TRM90649]
MNARPRLPDALLAAAICLLTLGPGQVLPGGLGMVALQAGLTLPLVWRRRVPLTAFGVIATVAAIQWLAGAQLPADVALLVALYTVAVHSTWQYTLTAATVVEAGAVLASVRWAPDGQAVLSVVALTAMSAVAVATGLHQRTRRAYLTALERDRDQRARLAVAEDRARIARDMHDIVTHNLSVMIALADSAHYVRDTAPDKSAAAIGQIAETGRQALADMRRSLAPPDADDRATDHRPRSGELHPAPGLAQLPELAGRLRAAGLITDLQVHGEAVRIPAATQLTVYRLVQEALTNTLKHTTPGTLAVVRIDLSPEAVTVEITDNGTARKSHGAGHGLQGMRDRVAAHGGSFRAGPLPAEGWQVSARLDLALDLDRSRT